MTPPDNHTYDFTSHPFVEIINRDEAATLCIGSPERRQTGDRLRPCVDRLATAIRLLRPMRYQAPDQAILAILAGLRMAPDDPEFLAGRSIEAWRIGGLGSPVATVSRPGSSPVVCVKRPHTVQPRGHHQALLPNSCDCFGTRPRRFAGHASTLEGRPVCSQHSRSVGVLRTSEADIQTTGRIDCCGGRADAEQASIQRSVCAHPRRSRAK
jgi:hypothetical protein